MIQISFQNYKVVTLFLLYGCDSKPMTYSVDEKNIWVSTMYREDTTSSI